MDALKNRGYENFVRLGAGGQANVYRSKKNGRVCAIKVVKICPDDDTVPKAPPPGSSSGNRAQVIHEDLKREIQIISRLKHPNCVRVYDIFRTTSKVYIAMELLPNGTGGDYIRHKGPLDYWHAQAWFCPISRAVRYLHSEQVAHRDIKLDNVLLDKYYNPILTDYGFSRFQTNDLSETFCGTRSHQAPEILRKIHYDIFKCDVWSLGVVLFILVNKDYPFDRNQTNVELIDKMMYRSYALRESIVEKLFQYELIKELIDLLLEPDFNVRMTMDKICAHPFFPQQEGEFRTRSTESLAADRRSSKSRSSSRTG